MNQEKKNLLFNKAEKHLNFIRSRIAEGLDVLQKKEKKSIFELKKVTGADRIVHEKLMYYNERRLDELDKLYPSPYFVRCDVKFDGESAARSIYIAKFPFTEESIYSWVAPIAAIRFEGCGLFTYTRHDGETRQGTLIRKDQFMIVGGKIVYLTTENKDKDRELIYQEYFSRKKAGFVLPEIIERMEGAQDKVIRASHRGPFMISGPAGSGKTTLALHRAAYLAQSPETAELYRGKSVKVFVQDMGTKGYFSHLLPELGIDDVSIVTFPEWAINILNIKDALYFNRFGSSEIDKDKYEYEKNRLLARGIIPEFSNYTFRALERFYSDKLPAEQLKTYKLQKKQKVLDRFDLTFLLMAYFKTFGRLDSEEEYYVQAKDFSLTRKKRRTPIKYSLVIIDEFQNYLPLQLKLIRSCINNKLNSLVYIGDLGQQVNLFTIKKWEEIGEKLNSDRHVRLSKIYRNTKNILLYIRSLGFGINIPENIKEGNDVIERVFDGPLAEIKYIEKIAAGASEGSIIGVLSADDDYLREFKKNFKKDKNIKILTMAEAQGVEFDVVILVGVSEKYLKAPEYSDMPEEFVAEKKRVQRDLLYVALTRAIAELHVLGSEKLSGITCNP